MIDQEPPSAIAAAGDSPRWETISLEIVCPLCEYNLRGLAEPRCPECGYQFQWQDLLDPARRDHPYLFELRRKKLIRSFFSTAAHGLLPRRFWTAIRPDHRFSTRRLLVYWLIAAMMTLVAIASEYGLRVVNNYQYARSWTYYTPYSPAVNGPPSPTFWVMPRPAVTPSIEWLRVSDSEVLFTLLILAWPWMIFVALMIFASSMQRAKIRAIHVVRCVVYCWDIALLTGAIALMVNGALAARLLLGDPPNSYDFNGLSYALWLGAAMLFAYRLVVAYRRYLKFDHVIATILSVHVIVVLAVFTAIAVMGEHHLIR